MVPSRRHIMRRSEFFSVPVSPKRQTLQVWTVLFLAIILPLVASIHLENDLEYLQKTRGGARKFRESAHGHQSESSLDDFGFDGVEDSLPPSVATSGSSAGSGIKTAESEEWSGGRSRVQRLWGISDTQAAVGMLFQYSLPSDAFSGHVDKYEVSSPQNTPLPSWLRFDTSSATFEGVPLECDIGEHYIVVKAISTPQPQSVAKDIFFVEVAPAHQSRPPVRVNVFPNNSPTINSGATRRIECDPAGDRTVLLVILDAEPMQVEAQDRVVLLKSWANFLEVANGAVSLQSHNNKEDLMDDENIILAGPGNAKENKRVISLALKWEVGCDGEVNTGSQQVVNHIKSAARDGSLSLLMKYLVTGWQLRIEASQVHRERRQVGSGDMDEENYDYEEEGVPDSRLIPTMSSPVFPDAPPPTQSILPLPPSSPPPPTHNHPHRHGHGDDSPLQSHPRRVQSHYSPRLYGTPVLTSTLEPVRPTVLATQEPKRGWEESVGFLSPTPTVYYDMESTVASEVSSYPTEPLPSSSPYASSFEEATSSYELESSLLPTSTIPVMSSSTVPLPGLHETIEVNQKNFPPTRAMRMQKQAVTAGKFFKIHIPDNTFNDFEDGDTRALRLIFKDKEGESLKADSWVQLDAVNQTIYGLPLENDVSAWKFKLEAMDSEGDTGSDDVEIIVRQHHGYRAVNHQFTMEITLDHKMDFPLTVDWEILLMNKLAALFGDRGLDNIFVRKVEVRQQNITFSWTNETLPRHECAKEAIEAIYNRMTLNKAGQPSTLLQQSLQPEFRAKRVTLAFQTSCSTVIPPPVVIPPQSGVTPPTRKEGTEYKRPKLRNQVDRITATVGVLLTEQVPEEFCIDETESATRNLRVYLFTDSHTALLPESWLQFDIKNQEFYGMPLDKDNGTTNYNLVCEGQNGLTAIDAMSVVVEPRPHPRRYNAIFSIEVSAPYDQLSTSAFSKRRLVERIAKLYQDDIDKSGISAPPYPPHPHPTRYIVVKSIERAPDGHGTVIRWYNNSLPYDPCPELLIAYLRRFLLTDDGIVAKEALEKFAPDNNVTRASVVPIGECLGELTPTMAVPPIIVYEEESPSSESAGGDDYLVTFIVPAVVIVAMLLLAAIIACMLYRKRRKGKMTMEDNKTFINKGIPIIFQDELEEKPDPAKSPVIMKEEKPPMPPPDYQGGQPPPPGTVRPSSRSSSATPPPTHHAHHPHNAYVPPEERSLLNASDGGGEGGASSPPYQPPPPFTAMRDSAGRHSRPKPTPAYRKPPPYVPP